jgi:beta-N-acetylhexosaminidase
VVTAHGGRLGCSRSRQRRQTFDDGTRAATRRRFESVQSREEQIMSKRALTCTRREFLLRAGGGIAAMALLSARSLAAAAGKPPASELDVKIGQMILAGFRDDQLKDKNPIVADIHERYLGGVVLFDYDVAWQKYKRNIKSPKQLQELDADLLDTTPVPPLLISVDQEGGRINRLKPAYGFPPSYSEQYLGTLNDLDFTHQCAETTAQTLKSVDINLNLAPVVDLNINPDNPIIGKYERSFSADPDIVTAHALEVIKAHHEYGVLTTLKHFPGHGSSTGDSHLGFVDVTDTWSEIELEPFRNIIQAEMCNVVMTAHIFNANLDPNYPATLSYPTITGILREQLGWDGIVITDDMGMGAITQYYGFETAIELAVKAGADILAYANNSSVFDPTIPTRAFGEIKRLVENGVITESRIDQSYRRIRQLKRLMLRS